MDYPFERIRVFDCHASKGLFSSQRHFSMLGSLLVFHYRDLLPCFLGCDRVSSPNYVVEPAPSSEETEGSFKSYSVGKGVL